MLKLPPWDTPSWRLPPELRPFYAAVNRVRDLEATPGASLEEIAAAHHAVGVAAVRLVRRVDGDQALKTEASHCALLRAGVIRTILRPY